MPIGVVGLVLSRLRRRAETGGRSPGAFLLAFMCPIGCSTGCRIAGEGVFVANGEGQGGKSALACRLRAREGGGGKLEGADASLRYLQCHVYVTRGVGCQGVKSPCLCDVPGGLMPGYAFRSGLCAQLGGGATVGLSCAAVYVTRGEAAPAIRALEELFM